MLPARQRLDAAEPGRDVAVSSGDVEAEFLGRIIEIGAERDVGDGRARAENERPASKPFVDNGKIAVDAALQKRHHRRVARRLGEILQEAIRPEEAVDLLVVEDDPAQGFEPLILALRFEDRKSTRLNSSHMSISYAVFC